MTHLLFWTFSAAFFFNGLLVGQSLVETRMQPKFANTIIGMTSEMYVPSKYIPSKYISTCSVQKLVDK
jgi:hypothetical protein